MKRVRDHHGRLAFIFTKYFFILGICALVFANGCSRVAIRDRNLSPPAAYAVQKLEKEKFSEEFISLLLKSYEESQRDKIVRLNVLGFLGKADYSEHYSSRAIKKCKEMIENHKEAFAMAEQLYEVPAELIAALLWVESKYGKVMGTFPVASVYFSLLQSDHPEVLQATLKSLPSSGAPGVSQVPGAEEKEVEQKAISRSTKKSEWALKELQALEQIEKKKLINVSKLQGSFAGAFGFPQFIPSSYLQWAHAIHPEKNPDLFYFEDAIISVAYYLKSNGWNNGSVEAQNAALFHYNRAQGYVDVIRKISDAMHVARSDSGK